MSTGVINKHSKLLAETLEEECNKTETDVVPIISKSALDIIGETAMGSKFHKASTAEIDYKEAVHSMGELTFYKIMRPMYYYSSFFEMLYFFTPSYRKERKLLKILHGFTNKMIDERERDFNGIPKTEHEDEDTNLYMKKEKMAMLDLLLSLKQKGLIDDEGIREEVDTFMLEGHDTVSSGLSFCLMLLACNRKIQDQIVKEMEEVLVDIGKEPTFNELQELKFMERCIKESLRMYPSVFYISRKLGEDTVTKDGYLLKSGTIVSFLIMHMQRNPKVYPNPDKFDPDRFLPENTKKRNPFAYLPFSAGPRNCIGQKFSFLEIKSILCSVLSNYILEPIDTPETIKLIPQFVLRAKDGIKVKFTKRNV